MSALLLQEAVEGPFTPVLPALILAIPLLGAVINGLGAFLWRENKAIPSAIGPIALVATFVIVVINFLGLQATTPDTPVTIVHLWTWIESGSLRVGVDLQFDQLSILMCMIVTGVGSLIHIYSVGYMSDDPGLSKFFAYLNLFVFFMLILVLGASLPMMFVGWEGVGLCSYLLIGFWFENKEYSDAGKKAFIVNRIGDAGFLVAMFLLFVAIGTLDFVGIVENAEQLAYGGALVTGITLLLFLGCTGKSAQIPLFVWLPDAMAGPTPVSALIHAATMVTAGVYLIARLGVLFALAPATQAVVAAVGAGTALFAATIATRQNDIKKVLAYSTISQLGYMFLAVGVGAFTAGIFHLMTHAFFKALLFLGAGAVIHAVHHGWDHASHGSDDPHADQNDMRNYGGLRAYMPKTWAFMWIATLAIAGVFPFAGFFSKDEIIWSAGAYGYPLLWMVAIATAALTAVYMTRLMVMTFHGSSRTFGHGGEEQARRYIDDGPSVMWMPLASLAVLSVVGGWVNIPEALPLPNIGWLHDWLEPVFEPAIRVAEAHGVQASHASPFGGGEALWAGISTVVAIVAVFATVRVLGRRTVPTEAEAVAPTGFARLLHDKWYVDELYDRLIIAPSLALWRGCWKIVDVGIIDGVVNGVGHVARLFGWMGGQLQSGRVTTYLIVFMLGALLVLGVLG